MFVLMLSEFFVILFDRNGQLAVGVKICDQKRLN